MTPPSVPHLTAEEICAEAERFLERYHPQHEIPVPIEEIVEIDMGIEIRPFRGFRDRFGVDGYISNDLSMIVVDNELMERYINRYRFTLAHEVGHCILHTDYIRAAYPSDPEEFKRMIKGIPPKIRSRLEYQAYEFAGCVLVPRYALALAWEEAQEVAQAQGIDLEELGEYGKSQVAGWIARQFQVSTQVVEIALRRDSLI